MLDSNQLEISDILSLFAATIDFLYERLGNDAFRRYYPSKGKFLGGFNLSAYEAILIGVARNLQHLQQLPCEEFVQKVKDMYSDPEYIRISGRGIKVLYRFQHLISVEYFSE